MSIPTVSILRHEQQGCLMVLHMKGVKLPKVGYMTPCHPLSESNMDSGSDAGEGGCWGGDT